MDHPEKPGWIRDIRVYRPSFLGMILLVCTPFLVIASAGVYGAVATIALMVVWLVLFAMGCRWFMPHPRRVVGVALLSMLAWLVAVLVAQ